MRTTVILSVIVALWHPRVGAQNDRPRPTLEQLLNVVPQDTRADEEARCRAIAARYARSAEPALRKRIDEIHAYCALTAKQRRRLELAAHGTPRRTAETFMRQVAEAKGISDPQTGTAELQKIRLSLMRAMREPNGVTMWQKAVASTLTERQRLSLQKNRAEKRAFENQVWVMNAVAELDRQARLQFEQRRDLVRRLGAWVEANQIPPPNNARRGAWKILPEDTLQEVVFPALDDARIARLLDLAPQSIRQEHAEATAGQNNEREGSSP